MEVTAASPAKHSSDELSTGKTRTTEPFSASLKTNVKLQLKTEKLANPAVSRNA